MSSAVSAAPTWFGAQLHGEGVSGDGGVDEHGYKMVNYSELPYLLLGAVRELKAEIGRSPAGAAGETPRCRTKEGERSQEYEETERTCAFRSPRGGCASSTVRVSNCGLKRAGDES